MAQMFGRIVFIGQFFRELDILKHRYFVTVLLKLIILINFNKLAHRPTLNRVCQIYSNQHAKTTVGFP